MMDVGLRRIAVGVVGFSMAVVGFFLSITVPAVSAVLPHLQRQAPEHSQARVRRRIRSHESRDLRQQESSPDAPHDVASEIGSESSNAPPSELSSTHHATSMAPPSLTSSPQSVLVGLPPLCPTSHGDCERKRIITTQHICTPQECSNGAITSGSEPALQENAERHARGRDGKKEKNSLPVRAVSWLKASPPPAVLHLQPSPRSSGESSRTSAVLSPSRAATFDQSALDAHHDSQRAPRRRNTFFGLRRTSKAPLRVDPETSPEPSASASMSMTHMIAPALSERGPEPTSPSTVVSDLHETASDAEANVRERKRRTSYFTRLKRKDNGKRTARVSGGPEGYGRDLGTSDRPSQVNERGRSSEKLPVRHICDRRCRPTTAPIVPPARTNPYEAPYYFPTPISPNAVNYVQRTLTEHRRASVSPSSAPRTPLRNEYGAPQAAGDASSTSTVQQADLPSHNERSSFPTSQRTSGKGANNMVSTPGLHRKSASISPTSQTGDEFGVLLNPPASSTPVKSGPKRKSLPA